MPSAKSFVHREHKPSDPAFLHDERRFLERQGACPRDGAEREHLVHDIEQARSMAARAGIRAWARGRGGEELLSLIGIGNRFRRDDAAGLEVVRRLRLAHPPGVILIEQEGEPGSLIEAWSRVDEALVIDGVSSGSAWDAPSLRRHRRPPPAEVFNPSTHAMGLPEAVELARELDRLPGRLIAYGIKGRAFPRQARA